MSSPVRDAIAKAAAGAIPSGLLVRQMLAHAGWLAPLWAFPPRDVFDGVVVFGDDAVFPEGELWIFTDREAADACAQTGAKLGTYVSGLRGRELLTMGYPRPIAAIQVNPGSPPDVGFALTGADLALPATYDEATSLEVALALALQLPSARDAAVARLASCMSVLAVCDPSGGLAGLPAGHGLGDVGGAACLFVAHDGLELFHRSLPAEVRPALKTTRGTGAVLCRAALAQGFDGVIVNPAGPGPIALPRAFVEAVARS